MALSPGFQRNPGSHCGCEFLRRLRSLPRLPPELCPLRVCCVRLGAAGWPAWRPQSGSQVRRLDRWVVAPVPTIPMSCPLPSQRGGAPLPRCTAEGMAIVYKVAAQLDARRDNALVVATATMVQRSRYWSKLDMTGTRSQNPRRCWTGPAPPMPLCAEPVCVQDTPGMFHVKRDLLPGTVCTR